MVTRRRALKSMVTGLELLVVPVRSNGTTADPSEKRSSPVPKLSQALSRGYSFTRSRVTGVAHVARHQSPLAQLFAAQSVVVLPSTAALAG